MKHYIYLLIPFFIMTMNLKDAQGQAVDTFSYSIGVLIGQNLQQQGLIPTNMTDFMKAIEDVASGQSTLVDAEQAAAAVQAFSNKVNESKYVETKTAGEQFLAANKMKANVVSLPSGLQYEILVEGNGPKPSASDEVTTHYHGTTVDGNVFDSSVERGEPATFPVNGVIQGWQEILQLMPVGSKWKVFIPYNLAYGERGAGAAIPPYSALIFDIELISIN